MGEVFDYVWSQRVVNCKSQLCCQNKPLNGVFFGGIMGEVLIGTPFPK